MKNNSIIFASIDREDYWVSSGLCFKLSEKSLKESYEDNYNELKAKLESKEVVAYVIEDNSLEYDLFEDESKIKFVRTYWAYGLVYEFENEEGETAEFEFKQTDYILTL